MKSKNKINMYILKQKKIFLFLVIGTFIFFIYSCSPRRLPNYNTSPYHINKIKLLKKLRQRANSIHSISSMAFVQVAYNGNALPWIRCRLFWSKFQNRVVIRIIGMGPFGQKIFDFLAGRQAIYLYVPSKSKVFTSSYSEAAIILGFNPLLLGQELKWVLNPYSLINKKPQRLNINKLYAFLRVDIGNFRYVREKIDPFDISVKTLSLPQLKIIYKNYAYFTSKIYYPQYIIISSKIRPLIIKIKLISILVNNIGCSNSVFNEAPFIRIPQAPLSLLFMNIT